MWCGGRGLVYSISESSEDGTGECHLEIVFLKKSNGIV